MDTYCFYISQISLFLIEIVHICNKQHSARRNIYFSKKLRVKQSISHTKYIKTDWCTFEEINGTVNILYAKMVHTFL